MVDRCDTTGKGIMSGEAVQPTTRGVWKEPTVQAQFCALIAQGKTEYEAFEDLRSSYEAADGTVITFRQYAAYKRRDHDFARAIAGAMQQAAASVERSLLQDLTDPDTPPRTKLSYLNLIENRVRRIEATATRHEEHDDTISNSVDDMLSASDAARQRALKAIEVRELEE